MDIIVRHSCSGINWDRVSEILKNGGMSYFDGDVHRKAFKNSYAVIFVFDGDTLIGFGRVISDGTYQASMYDVAVSPEYQGKTIGTTIVNHLLDKIPGCNVILYASPGKEHFYETLNFRRMKTGMALFLDHERMSSRGFIE
nr:GNAT family N-acetyltransferase [uncultured Methanospirillum sp.]